MLAACCGSLVSYWPIPLYKVSSNGPAATLRKCIVEWGFLTRSSVGAPVLERHCTLNGVLAMPYSVAAYLVQLERQWWPVLVAG